MLLAVGFFAMAGCHKKSNSIPCGACFLALQIPNLNFRVVDKTTGQNLFFGSAPAYKISQLKMRQLINGVADSAILRVDSANQSFNVGIRPIHPTDTVTMQIAGLPQDILLFNTASVGECCPTLEVTSVTYNGATVYTAANGPKIAILAK